MLVSMETGASGGGGKPVELWSNSSATLSAGDISVSNLENYDALIFETPNGGGFLAAVKLSMLDSGYTVGYAQESTSTTYMFYRKVTHSATNTLTLSTGYYIGSNGGSGSGVDRAVFSKIYGVNLS